MIISSFNLGLGSSDKKDGMCLEMLKLGQSIKDIWSWLTVFIMEGALCPCSRPDLQKRESRGWFLMSFTLILLMSLWWIVLFIVGSYFTGYYEFISFFLFRFILLMSLSFFANPFRFEFHSSMHIVTSHHTFLCVNQLCLTKLFAFHAFDQTSWRLEVKCWWYILFYASLWYFPKDISFLIPNNFILIMEHVCHLRVAALGINSPR